MQEILKSIAEKFQQQGIDNAWKEIRLILAYILRQTYSEVFLNLKDIRLSEAQKNTFEAICARRLQKEPLSKIFGKKEFWGYEFKINQYTLGPRPETEVIIEKVLTYFPYKDYPYRILDLGTGSGCLLASLLMEYPQAMGYGVDLSEESLKIAQENIDLFGLGRRSMLLCSYWAESLQGHFDIIVSNPPYIGVDENIDEEVISFDPALALFSPSKGILPYKEIAKGILHLMNPKSLVFLEIGYGKINLINDLLRDDYVLLETVLDLQNIPRTIVARKN